MIAADLPPAQAAPNYNIEKSMFICTLGADKPVFTFLLQAGGGKSAVAVRPFSQGGFPAKPIQLNDSIKSASRREDEGREIIAIHAEGTQDGKNYAIDFENGYQNAGEKFPHAKWTMTEDAATYSAQCSFVPPQSSSPSSSSGNGTKQ